MLPASRSSGEEGIILWLAEEHQRAHRRRGRNLAPEESVCTIGGGEQVSRQTAQEHVSCCGGLCSTAGEAIIVISKMAQRIAWCDRSPTPWLLMTDGNRLQKFSLPKLREGKPHYGRISLEA